VHSATLGFYSEDGGSKFLQNTGSIYLSDYMPSYPEESENKNAISLIKNSSLFFKMLGTK
jgi:hypothetical protein